MKIFITWGGSVWRVTLLLGTTLLHINRPLEQLVIGLKNSRQIVNKSQNPIVIVTNSRKFCRALYCLHVSLFQVLVSLMGCFTYFVFGQSNYFGLGFTTPNENSSLPVPNGRTQ